jgi:hypothetical protein
MSAGYFSWKSRRMTVSAAQMRKYSRYSGTGDFVFSKILSVMYQAKTTAASEAAQTIPIPIFIYILLRQSYRKSCTREYKNEEFHPLERHRDPSCIVKVQRRRKSHGTYSPL